VVVEQALAQRAAAGIKIRQTLRTLRAPVPAELKAVVADEVNVLEVVESPAVELVTTLDDELRAMGLVREFVRQVNALRKERGLTLADRIVLNVGAPETVVQVLEAHKDSVIKGTLARELTVSPDQTYATELEVDGKKITVAIE
jgi:isoleucyl-tRNA synthetase